MRRVSYYPHEGCKTRQAISRAGSEAKHMPLATSFPLSSHPQQLPILAQNVDRRMMFVSGKSKGHREAALGGGYSGSGILGWSALQGISNW